MRRLAHRITLGLGLAMAALPVGAQEFRYLGLGRIMINDAFAGTYDRWQTGSAAVSLTFGPEWTGTLPTMPGQVIELRFLAQVIAPDNLRRPHPLDRPYANAVSFGLHTHFDLQGIEIAAGGDLVITGDQTGLHRFQSELHDVIGVPGPAPATRAAGIGNGLHPTAVIEAGHSFDFGEARIRPFVEGRYGVETLIRAGFDLTLGTFGTGTLMVRDPVSGHRYRAAGQAAPGLSLIFGGDIAHVADSVFLPGPRYGTEDRMRLRVGFNWQGRRAAVYYGLSWLTPEFSSQPEGQVVGALRLDYAF
ncbi:hypothetical protein ATO6_08415 [Oceanicola sp. 22II-s10i]|uniref:lipid A-modifier LpxR family protein n=1 Tax=Oceanicola sp. 22II-s10i TaxID=1317116 RepID=UPI000B524640|nr:lipid A-modifier LpxR family protein [Oceanicola sp. 22II-s10i]OWU85068.1 hypothetical protein ATO6_08415 [Oceanicola sp. 22II-s10i]